MATKHKAVVIAAALAVGFGLYPLVVRERSAEIPPIPALAPSASPADQDVSPIRPEAQQQPAPTTSATKLTESATPRSPPPTERVGVQIGEWNAKTQEEADWLNANLYPNEEELSAPAHPDDLPPDLIPRSARDLSAAQNVIGQKHVSDEDRERARAVLLNGAADGYAFAFVALGMAFEQSSPVEAQAYFRAALYLGDWSVALRPRVQLPHMADVAASLMAHQMLSEADDMRAQRGLPPLARKVRPGLDPMLAVFIYGMEQERAGGRSPQ